jgi:hypothetical protein
MLPEACFAVFIWLLVMTMTTAMFSTSTMIATTTAATMVAMIATKMTAAVAMKLRPAATMVSIIEVAITTGVRYPTVMIASPVIGIPDIAAVAYNNLVMTAPVAGIPCSVNIVSYPWGALINYHFITVV